MTRTDLPTGTVTFLFTDIAGSTRMVGELGPAVFRDVLEQHHALLREAFAAHDGAERGTQGDSFLVVFRDAPAAVAAATDAQRAIGAATWPDGVEVRVRMGLHTGIGLPGGDDYVGLDINRAARIAGAGHGGQVLLSEATRSLVDGGLPPGVTMRTLGEHRLKDLVRPERIHQLVIEGLASDFPPLKAQSGAAATIPPRLTSFVGRDRELATLRTLLESTRLLTLTGAGGSGKTSLATELARGLVDRFVDGTWIVPLEAVTDPELVGPAIAGRLGLVEAPGRTARDLLVSFAAERSMLLVLDNFEQVLDGAPLVADLLREAPRLTVVVTSRAPLHLSGEQEFPVPPLALPGLIEPASAALDSPAIALFVERAARVVPSFRLTDADAAAVAEICRRLDGLPLGIELAAARVGLLGVRDIARRLADRLDLPGAAPRDLPTRQRTLTSTVEWSVDLLDDRPKALLARLAVFAGGWRLVDAETVCGIEDPDPVIDDLSVLADHSLVQPLATPTGPRFRLLETIRLVAAARLRASGDEAIMRRRHAAAFLAMAEDAAQRLTRRGQAQVIAQLEAEHDNLRAALAWAIAQQEVDTSLRLTAALWRFWQIQGHVQEGSAWVDAALALPSPDPATHARVLALGAAGSLAWWRSELPTAHALYQAQVDTARTIDDGPGLADALFNLTHTTRFLGEPGSDARTLAEAIALFERLGDAGSAARARTAGAIGHVMDDPAETTVLLEALVPTLEALEDDFYASLATGTLAWIAVAQGDVQRAIRHGLKSLDQSYALGDMASLTLSLHDGAAFLLAMGEVEAAATVEAAFETLSRRHGIRPPTGFAVGPETELGAALTRLLSDPAFEEARQHGRGMSLDATLDFAFERLRARYGASLPIEPREMRRA